MHYLTAHELGAAFDAGDLSPVEVTEALLERIGELDSSLHCYSAVLEQSARVEAASAARELRDGRRRSPVHGIPIAVKDLCDVAGLETRAGTAVLRGTFADEDAVVVRRLRDAGAVVLGKLHLTEGAMAGYHPDFDVPVNPWGPNRWAGASSSGSGAATAAGLCVAALGTDTGGSIRLPAAANGVVGIKPTYGRVSRRGVFPLAESLDHVGPFARSVWDAAAVLEVIAGDDPADPTSLPEPAPSLLASITRGVEGLRVGVDTGYVREGVGDETARSVLAAVEALAGLGAEVVHVEVPRVDDRVWTVLASAEAAVAHEAFYPARAAEYGPFLRDRLALGAGLTGIDVARAQHERARFSGALRRVFAHCDAIACPALLGPAPVIPPDVLRGGMRELAEVLHVVGVDFIGPFDLSGNPTITLPSGFDDEGMPLAAQFVGRHGEEARLCALGHAYQTATDWHRRHPA